jgi:uncharacterized repeat protein (TIGR03803 family)
MGCKGTNGRSLLAACLLAASLVTVAAGDVALGQSYTLKTLVNFNGGYGSGPYGGLTMDGAGNLYGTTQGGGAGYGTVFKLDASNGYALSTLADFGASGSEPAGALAMDAKGNIYGTTQFGPGGCGTVFKLDASSGYAVSTLVAFNIADGSEPCGGVTMDGSGNLYGTTAYGGTAGSGTVFKLDASKGYALSTLANFSSASGYNPVTAPIVDRAGNVFGTAGGWYENGDFWVGSTAFKLDASNNYALSTLVNFTGPNGNAAQGGLIMDAAGNLYGTASTGGAGHWGTVFKLDASNGYALSALANFNRTNGADPEGALMMDAAGNIYGTTSTTAFELVASKGYALSTLATFTTSTGDDSKAGLTIDAKGDLFGTNWLDGTGGGGTVFELVANHIPGDINGDGLVDVADYNIWAANVGKTGAAWCQGDLNGDGLVDVADYNMWAANVGKTAGVPEPATPTLLALGGLALLRRKAIAAGERCRPQSW